MDASTVKVTAIQHVTKKSSEKLLRKFADDDDDHDKETKAIKKSSKRRRSGRGDEFMIGGGEYLCQSPPHTALVLEKRSLLPCDLRKKRSFSIKQSGVPLRFETKSDLKNKLFTFASIQKTFRRTLERTSKVILEKHYNRHRRLVNDQ